MSDQEIKDLVDKAVTRTTKEAEDSLKHQEVMRDVWETGNINVESQDKSYVYPTFSELKNETLGGGIPVGKTAIITSNTSKDKSTIGNVDSQTDLNEQEIYRDLFGYKHESLPEDFRVEVVRNLIRQFSKHAIEKVSVDVEDNFIVICDIKGRVLREPIVSVRKNSKGTTSVVNAEFHKRLKVFLMNL